MQCSTVRERRRPHNGNNELLTGKLNVVEIVVVVIYLCKRRNKWNRQTNRKFGLFGSYCIVESVLINR